jgi:hypothetical protein
VEVRNPKPPADVLNRLDPRLNICYGWSSATEAFIVTARPVAYIGDEIAFALPPSSNGKERAMKRRRFNQTELLEDRLGQQAIRLRAEAKLLPPGGEREKLLRQARQAETGAHMSEWLRSPGLKPPT